MIKPLIIAEIGVNYYEIAEKHNIPLLDAAKLMIEMAHKSGADVAKFQTYKSEKLTAENSPAYWDLIEEPTKSQRQLFSMYDKFNYQDYVLLADYCSQIGIEFLTTVFDTDNIDNINKLVCKHKIASADITNVSLLRKIGSMGKPVLLSTGASNYEEIVDAVKILKEFGANNISLFHCVLNYPTSINDANLIRISSLKRDFPNLHIGYSDHTKFNQEVLITAWLLGAEIIEKHFTLDKNLKGNDHYHAADCEDLKSLNNTMNRIMGIVGTEFTEYFNPKEKLARRNARRGVYLAKDVKTGQTISDNDVVFLRPQLDGISPAYWYSMIGEKKTYLRDIKIGEQLVKGQV